MIRIGLGDRGVTTKSGRNHSYDCLPISMGRRLEPEAVPGLSGDLGTFYTLEEAMKPRVALKTFNEGRIVTLTPETPIACLGVPSKFTNLLDCYLRHVRGEDVRKDVETFEIQVQEPQTVEPLVGLVNFLFPSSHRWSVHKTYGGLYVWNMKAFKLVIESWGCIGLDASPKGFSAVYILVFERLT